MCKITKIIIFWPLIFPDPILMVLKFWKVLGAYKMILRVVSKVHSFLRQCFAQSSFDIIWWYLQLIFSLSSAASMYHRFMSTEGTDRVKDCIKNEWTLDQYGQFHEGGKKADDTPNNFCRLTFLILLMWKARRFYLRKWLK